MTDVIRELPPRPAWSNTTETMEWGREFTTVFGDWKPLAEPPFAVELVQAELIDWEAEPSTIQREAPYLRINGSYYTPEEARVLMKQIQAALSICPDS